jgi:endonuclease-3
VLDAPPGVSEEAVKCGGLAEIKMARVRTILAQLLDEGHTAAADNGAGAGAGAAAREPSLEYVRALSTDAAKAELTRFNGVGPKTASCVLMFTLGRAEVRVASLSSNDKRHIRCVE